LLQEGLTREVRQERGGSASRVNCTTGPAGLTALNGLSRVERSAASSETREMAASLRAMAVDTMALIRSLALDLRPAALDELGLVSALRPVHQGFLRARGIPVGDGDAIVDDCLMRPDHPLPYRQEALTNVAKHANASRAWVALRNGSDELRLLVADNGKGFDAKRAMNGENHQNLGLFGIQERCHLLGGRLDIISPGDGSLLRVTIPFALPVRPENQETSSALLTKESP
jgi:signal transduction histidine kinase